MSKVGRNDPCPCGSGKKYKHCHGAERAAASGVTQTTGQLMEAALHYHRQGRLNEAEALYRQILASEPKHADATHLTGLIAHQRGKHAEAVEWISRALEAGATAPMHNNLAEALSALGRTEEAIGHYRKAVELNDSYEDALNNLGVALTRAGKLAEAEAVLKRAIERHANALNPHANLGNVYQALDRYDEAIAQYRIALGIDPKDAQTHNNLGNAYKDTGRLDLAIASYQTAIELNPTFVDAHYNLGIALSKKYEFAGAESSLRKTIALRPEFAEAYGNLGEVLKGQGKIAEAEHIIAQALRFASTRAEALAALGALAYAHGHPDDAFDCLKQAIALEPARGDFHKSMGSILLLLRQFPAGWRKRDSRWHILEGDFARVREDFRPYTWWPGMPLNGKTLLVWSEQGIGDEIWAAGMYGDLLAGPARGERVLIECRPKLFTLFKRSFPAAEVVAKTDPPDERLLKDVDFQIACGSLGRIVRPDLESLPRREQTGGAYLFVDPEREAFWRNRIAALGPGLKVGICWRSSDSKGERALSCTCLLQWGKVLGVPGIHFINLQYDECETELDEAGASFGKKIIRFLEVDMFNDLDETAALMKGLDLVISAPTAVSILSAALGVPTWQMNYEVEWQCHGLANNQWYPTMRNYARRWDQDWGSVLSGIADDLRMVAVDEAALVRDREPAHIVERARKIHAQGGFDAARAMYRSVLARDPEHAEARHLLGLAEHQSGDNEVAVTHLRKAAAISPRDAEIQHHLGIILKAKGDTVSAIAHFRAAIGLRPRFAEAANNLGVALRECGQITEAAKWFAEAVELRPRFVLALANLGAVRNDCRQFGQAESVLRSALRIDPQFAPAHINLMLALSAQGKIRDMWPEYEWRWQIPDSLGRPATKRPFSQPPWPDGEAQASKILVWGEQGVGDQLWSAGMLQDLKTKAVRGSGFVLECAPKLLGLFRRTYAWAEVVAQSDPPDARCIEGVDYQIGGGSLGQYLRKGLGEFPKREETGGAYLFADAGREGYWRERLEKLGLGLRVGISWRSSNLRGERALSCTRLGQWGEIFKVTGVQFVNLQYDECEAELEEAEAQFGVKIERFAEVDMYDDLDETAALMRGSDLVISAPTSVSILSAALGVPTWQMNYGAEWQCHGLPNNPWYPTMRNFARRWDQSWEEILSEIASTLAAKAGAVEAAVGMVAAT